MVILYAKVLSHEISAISTALPKYFLMDIEVLSRSG